MPQINLTPAGWLGHLTPLLDEQAAAVRAPTDYYNGIQRLAFATAKFREAFSRYFPPMANNWMKLVVDAPVSRLNVVGFRFDPDPTKASWDQAADQEAWSIWQANNMDALSRMAHLEAVKCGVSYLLVSPPEGEDDEPQITVEHPSQFYVYLDPGNRRRRLAAIKRWVDVDGYAYATVYLPDELQKWRSSERMGNGRLLSRVQWVRRGDDPGGPNSIGVVPGIPLENTPDLMYGGRSDLEVAMPIQDAVNKLCLDMQVSSEYHAYPQRWATGWDRAQHPDGREMTGREVEVAVGQTRLVRATSPETSFGQFAPGNVDNYIRPIEMYVDHLAAVTQTPAYYLKGQMANLSAEALHAADAGLVDRCWAKIGGGFSDTWEETMRVCFLAKGDTQRGRARTAEVLWKDPEKKSLAQVTDAAVKMRESLSVPLEMCWELMGWSPQQIQQAKAMMNLPETPPARPNGGTPTSPEDPPRGGLIVPTQNGA